ncbi:MAG: RES family NAD+ phosphorylase [Bacteroidetes bacterium]|nr:RES family NAD+ phosphorylase [Bacteroidota bacterium]MCH8232006.1 RES family NAD+ phosphorylase [Bacteroidota bacterium]
MLVFRITKQKYIRDMSGESVWLYPGRWNAHNTPVIYTSESLALAAWEIAVRIDPINFPENLAYVKIKIPDDSIQVFSKTGIKASVIQQNISISAGMDFIKKGKFIALKVPSVVIPESFNFMLNPYHNAYSSKVKIIDINPFRYDNRTSLW